MIYDDINGTTVQYVLTANVWTPVDEKVPC